MVHVFTYTTEIKLNKDNQALIKYIKDYLPEFNHIQRVVFYKIKNHYRQYGKINNKLLYNDIKDKFNLTSRAVNSIIFNMSGRFEAIKELKQYELNQLYKKKDKLEKELNKILNEKSLIKATKLNQKYINDKDIESYKNLKVSIYWKRNKFNKLNQRIKNLEEEINTHNYKICFGTKHLLKRDYQKFIAQRDSELYFVGTAQETACNNNYRFGKGNYTTGDFNFIANNLAEYCLEKGKDLAIEKLNFNTKRTQMFKGKNKKYNEMLSSLAYSKFDKIITSKCVKNRIFLHKVNPAWTSYIAENKYCSLKKLNIHSGASYVIARRGQSLKDKLKK